MLVANYEKGGTTVIGSTATSIFWYDNRGVFGEVSVFMGNYGPASLVNAVIQVSGNGGIWGTIDGTSFGSMGSAGVAFGEYEASYRYWRGWGWTTGTHATCVFHVNPGSPYTNADMAY